MRAEHLPGDAWFTSYLADTDWHNTLPPAPVPPELAAFMNPQQRRRPPLLGSLLPMARDLMHGPVRDTLLMSLGGLLVAIGYVLGAIVTAGGV